MPQADSQTKLWHIVYTCRTGWATVYLNSLACRVKGPSCPPSNLKLSQWKQRQSVAHRQERMAWEAGWDGAREPIIPLYLLGAWTYARRHPACLEERNCSHPSLCFFTLELHSFIQEWELDGSLEILSLKNKLRLLVQQWGWNTYLHTLSNLTVSTLLGINRKFPFCSWVA